MDFNRILEEAKSRKFLIKDLAEKAGMTANGLNNAIESKSMKVVTLEAISELFGVSPAYWWHAENMAMESAHPYGDKALQAYIMDYRDAKKQWAEERSFLKDQIAFLQNVVNSQLPTK